MTQEEFLRFAEQQRQIQAEFCIPKTSARHDKENGKMVDYAAQNMMLRNQVEEAERKLKRVQRPVEHHEVEAIRAMRERHDSVAGLYGAQSPEPAPGATPVEYQRSLLENMKQHSPKFRDARVSGMDPVTLGVMAEKVYNDAESNVVNAQHPPGVLIPIQKRDHAGRLVTTYVGDIGSWMDTFASDGCRGNIVRNPPKN